MRQGMLKIHRAWHANLLRFGMDQQLIDEWSRKVDEGGPMLCPITLVLLWLSYLSTSFLIIPYRFITITIPSDF